MIALCVLIGVYAMRYNVVLGGQMESKISKSIVHMSVPLTGFDSVQTVIGVFAIAFLLFLFFSWLLPWREAAKQAVETSQAEVGMDAIGGSTEALGSR
jgi:predicted membrane protein